MKLVKIFGAVMAVHAAVFMFVFAIPGCRSTGKKTAAQTPAADTGAAPVAVSEPVAPAAYAPPLAAEPSIRFSPTRPGTAPAAAAVVEPAAAPEPATYTVVKGDNLWAIARRHGVTVKDLTAANKLRADSTLQLGQKLVIPGKTPAAPAASVSAAPAPASAPAPAASAITHTVKSGETLGGIARRYQVKVGDIATANNIADPAKLRVGQVLKIPGWQAPKSAAPAAAPAPASVPVVAPSFTPAPAPEVPVSPIFGAPEPAPVSPVGESPLITPAAPSDAPLIRVEESGAPRIE